MKVERVVVTGGGGNIGRQLVKHLIGEGRDVRVLDCREVDIAGSECAVCNLTDPYALRNETRGFDAIIHLGGIARPSIAPAHEVFHINSCGTFNVFYAAVENGISKVVCASSINVLGCLFGAIPFKPKYFPIDETHPTDVTSDAYSFSKCVVEDIAGYFWRRDGVTSLCLRLAWVCTQKELYERRRSRDFVQMIIDELSLYDEHPWIEYWLDVHSEMHYSRMRENPNLWHSISEWNPELDPRTVCAVDLRDSLLAAIEVNDCCRAFSLALDTDLEGCHALNICDSQNWLGIETENLLQTFFPDVPDRKRKLCGPESLLDTTKAESMLGFRSWGFGLQK